MAPTVRDQYPETYPPISLDTFEIIFHNIVLNIDLYRYADVLLNLGTDLLQTLHFGMYNNITITFWEEIVINVPCLYSKNLKQ